MANRGWGKIANAGFKRIIPTQCPMCQHFGQSRDGEWWLCTVKLKRLSNPHTERGNCDQFEQCEPKIPQQLINELIADGKEFREERAKKRKQKQS